MYAMISTASARPSPSTHEAKKAGITIVSGLGDSPGLTNILAKYCCDQLD